MVQHFNTAQEADQGNFKDKATSADLEVVEVTLLLEWFAENYRQFGCTLELITNNTQDLSSVRAMVG